MITTIMAMVLKNKFRIVLAALFVSVLTSEVAYATHSWGGYHWARTANPFLLKLGDNVSSAWDAHLALTSNDWSASSVLDTLVVAGGTNSKNCKPVNGRVEVCSGGYGRNGWLGIASIWTAGGHIVQGVVKMNDTYFKTAQYNTPAWRNLVLCQEVGHTLGLDHQDEDFYNVPLGTCMDYSADPTLNQHPNAHDYEMLETIYAHMDTTTTLGQSVSSLPDIDHSNPGNWGREIRRSHDGRASLHERDLGNGKKIFTFVFWAK